MLAFLVVSIGLAGGLGLWAMLCAVRHGRGRAYRDRRIGRDRREPVYEVGIRDVGTLVTGWDSEHSDFRMEPVEDRPLTGE